ncbi:MAG: hypothetical protein ACRD2G_07875, partial [Terriglobia bacterium]
MFVTNSFSGLDRMDNLLKPQRWPTQALLLEWGREWQRGPGLDPVGNRVSAITTITGIGSGSYNVDEALFYQYFASTNQT